MLINLTPHAITLVNEDGTVREVVQPSGALARVAAHDEVVDSIGGGFPVVSTVYGEVEGLPEPSDDVIYIVSALVAQRVHGRRDVLVPARTVRDDKGRIIGCKALARI